MIDSEQEDVQDLNDADIRYLPHGGEQGMQLG